MYTPHSLCTRSPHQAFQRVKSSGLYTEKYGTFTLVLIIVLLDFLFLFFVHLKLALQVQFPAQMMNNISIDEK